MYCILFQIADGSFRAISARVLTDSTVEIVDESSIPASTFVEWVAQNEREAAPRWVWSDTAKIYPLLLRAGVRVERAHDLRLARAILRNNRWTSNAPFIPSEPGLRAESDSWDQPAVLDSDALFEREERVVGDCVSEFQRQMQVLGSATPEHRGRLSYLLAAESAGALIAVEMTFAGVPWDASTHDSILAQALGPRPHPGVRPNKLEAVSKEVRSALDSPHLNPDSPKDLLKALQKAGMDVKSTAKWEIQNIKHPAVEPLLRYKKLSRMMTANGWTWMDQWVSNGRFRPVYVPGGVVTGRWGADGGGALQLPHFVRPSVVADPGWTFVIADAAQLEPRILSAMSGDRAMAHAGKGHDMYQGIADAGVVESREHAKFGMLGAMYGGTTGVSAQVLPKFKVAFPQAMALVESAARAGEQGGTVHTWLGRTSIPGYFGSPTEGEDHSAAQDRRTKARSYGRFTRNFICQGTAAEWALLWMANVRQRLHTLSEQQCLSQQQGLPQQHGLAQEHGDADRKTANTGTEPDSAQTHSGVQAEASHIVGNPITRGPHLVFFLHDEILIHTPIELAEQVKQIVLESAKLAGTTLFAGSPVEFPVSAAISTSYDNPKG